MSANERWGGLRRHMARGMRSWVPGASAEVVGSGDGGVEVPSTEHDHAELLRREQKSRALVRARISNRAAPKRALPPAGPLPLCGNSEHAGADAGDGTVEVGVV